MIKSEHSVGDSPLSDTSDGNERSTNGGVVAMQAKKEHLLDEARPLPKTTTIVEPPVVLFDQPFFTDSIGLCGVLTSIVRCVNDESSIEILVCCIRSLRTR